MPRITQKSAAVAWNGMDGTQDCAGAMRGCECEIP